MRVSAHSLNYSTYGKLETIGADLLIWKVSCTEDVEFRKPSCVSRITPGKISV